jgi:hypothetical protein
VKARETTNQTRNKDGSPEKPFYLTVKINITQME